MMLKLSLHIGAHKTATTHLQGSLRASRSKLEAANISYWDPKRLRADGKNIEYHLALDGDVRAALHRMAAGSPHLVISEENLIRRALPMGGRRAKRLYENATRDLVRLGEGAPDQPVDLFLSVRSFAPFFRSFYAQVLMGGYFQEFASFLGLSCYDTASWTDLARRLVALDTVQSLTVWRYEDYPRIAPALLGEMLGSDLGALPLKDERSHEGLSDAAVEHLLSVQRQTPGQDKKADKEIRRPLAAEARRAFPVGADHSRFDPWSPEDYAQSNMRYEADLAELAQLPKTQLLKT